MDKSILDQHQQNVNLAKAYKVGIFGCAMTGLTQDFFTPFLLLNKATAFHISVLNSAINLFSSLGQLPSADLTARFNSRKKIVMLFVAFQTFILFLLTLAALVPDLNPYLIILAIAAFTMAGAVTFPGWISMLSDMVDTRLRGDYFGWRARNLGFLTIAATTAAGTTLFLLNTTHPHLGFFVIFGLAFLTRLCSYGLVRRIQEPTLVFTDDQAFSLWQFFRRIKESNFAQFVLFTAAVNFSVNLAAPFFSIFMLRDLGFNYLIYTFINIAAPVTLYSVIRRWGLHADRVGNLKVLKIIAPMFGFIPLLWIFCQNPFFLIAAEMISGFLWAGFNLCTSNFIIDAVSPEKRTRCISYFHVVNGFALALGAFIGGQLLPRLPALKGHPILSLFLISSILRMFLGLIMPLRLKEVRPIERVSSQKLLFSMIGLKPIAGIDRKSIQI